jgi:hypothetical protein
MRFFNPLAVAFAVDTVISVNRIFLFRPSHQAACAGYFDDLLREGRSTTRLSAEFAAERTLRGMLSVVVVRGGGDGRPGPGFLAFSPWRKNSGAILPTVRRVEVTLGVPRRCCARHRTGRDLALILPMRQ